MVLVTSCESREGDDTFWQAETTHVAPDTTPDPVLPPAPPSDIGQAKKRSGPIPLKANGDPFSFASLVKKVNPGVVNIYTKTVVGSRGRRNGYFFGAPQRRVAESLGTGFVVDKDGSILTNHHVVGNASAIQIRTHDGKEYPAKVIGSDPKTDIALIQVVGAHDLHVLPMGDSDKLEVGDWVVAIGNALGLSSTVTAGIVSAKGRSEVPLGGEVAYMDFIQTDASINPGNSGGPLLNIKGEVVGINTAVSREGQGIGFAIPMSMVRAIYPQLKRSGKVSRSWLGIYVKALDKPTASSAGLAEAKGAVVRRVVKGGPAETAGLLQGDIITRFNNEPINDINDLRWKSSVAGIGHTAEVNVRRGRKDVLLKLKMAKNPYN